MIPKTQIISLIALNLLIVTFSLPSAFAHAGTVENTYWQDNPRMCYDDTNLNTLDFEDDTSNNYNTIKSELDQSVSAYNNSMEDIDILPHTGTCPQRSIHVGTANLGWWGAIAVNTLYETPGDADRALYSQINFNTQKGFGDDSNTCSSGDVDIEWVMNHELGHAIGLIHHWHFEPYSVMHNFCDPVYDALQSTDHTAVDINY